MPLPVVVLYENPDWLPPLEAGLKAEGLSYELREVWQGVIDPAEEPAEAIYLNRMSPSSHTRGHLESVDLMAETLAWLEHHGRHVVNGSRAFALGQLSKKRTKWIEERQRQLDFLVSSLPGTECSEPACADLQVCREFVNWAPSIIYCLGLGGQIYMDFYWEVAPTFDEELFLKTLVERVDAVRHHTNLPPMY